MNPQANSSLSLLKIVSTSFFLLFTLSACASLVSAGVNLQPTATPANSQTAALTATPEPSATLAFESELPSPTPAARPIVEVTFPAVSTQEVTHRRPPLYTAPLALNPNDHFYFYRPVPIEYAEEPVADYRYGYILPKTTTLHTGTDIKEPLHTPIIAAGDGKVVFAGYGLLKGNGDKDDPYGLAVMIRHNLSYQNHTILTVYAHMEKTTVVKGDWVKAGDQIGYVGLTGATSGPHVHIEIRLEVNDLEYEVQNPELWMVPPVGYGVLAGRIMSTGGALLGERKIWVRSLETDETWTMYTYSVKMNHVDAYYRENLVLSDLPAGKYEVSFYYYGLQKQIVEIRPGAVTFFRYMGKNGFVVGDPPVPFADEFLHP
jgi:murein DD-endopeptidase MepM/ murein hydrolase activator NlpD